MIFQALTLLFAAAAVNAANPKVMSPNNMTYTAGDTIDIKWADSTTGFLNIDLVDAYPEVLQFPLTIAQGVPGEAGKYSWKIPSELKTAAGYRIRVWGSHQPSSQEDGLSHQFTILNAIPGAVNTFTILAPNKDHPCHTGELCNITWDFPQNTNYPAMVDIALYRVGNPSPLMNIATVSSSLKTYSWAVPNDPMLMTGDVYVSVSGQGMPVAGPGMANDMGGNSHSFAISTPPPPAPVEPKVDAKKEEPKKEEPKKTKPEPESKVSGASKKEKNAAAAISAGEIFKVAALLAGAAAFVPVALML